MMKVLLISFSSMAINVRCLSSCLKERGYKTYLAFCLSDFNKTNSSKFIKLINSLNIKLIGISLVTDDFKNAKYITTEIKKELALPVIWGGAHPTIASLECLKYADMVCVGEGEEALLELCDKMNRKVNYFSVQNIWFKKEEKIIRNELRHLVENLDKYFFPDYGFETHYIVIKEGYEKFDEKSLDGKYNIMTSRGCPFSCSYCYNNYRRKMYAHKGKYLRQRSINNILDELKLAKKKFKSINIINFWDDNFLMRNINDIKEFSEYYEKEINIPFFCLANPSYISEEKIKLLKKCGIAEIQVGIQTGSENINKNIYNRSIPNSIILDLAKLLRKYNIKVGYDIIFNNPYETRDDLIDTIELLLKFPKPFKLRGYNLIFYPGSEITEKAIKDNYILVNTNPDETSTIEAAVDSPLRSFDKVALSSRLYQPNFSIGEKRYLNSIIGLIPYYPKFLIKSLMHNENRLAKTLLKSLINLTKWRLLTKRYLINFLGKKIISALDNQFKTNLYEKAVKLEKAYYNSNFLNAVRRSIDPAVANWKYKLRKKDKGPLKLHLGSGDKYFEGYINIDWRKTRATDLVCDIRKLPYPENSVDLIETYHVIEHLPRHDLPRALETWHRILIPGGKLIIECPDFDAAVKEYIGGDAKRIDNIFGLQRFNGDVHLFGYNFKSLKKLLEEAGFKNIKEKEPQDYHSKDEPCLRVKCVKNDNL